MRGQNCVCVCVWDGGGSGGVGVFHIGRLSAEGIHCWGGEGGHKINVFAIFSGLCYYFSLILHRIAAWDNVKHLVKLKSQQNVL